MMGCDASMGGSWNPPHARSPAARSHKPSLAIDYSDLQYAFFPCFRYLPTDYDITI